MKALKVTTYEDLKDVIELYQKKHYLMTLLRRKRTELKILRVIFEQLCDQREEKELCLEDQKAAHTEGTLPNGEEVVSKSEQELK